MRNTFAVLFWLVALAVDILFLNHFRSGLATAYQLAIFPIATVAMLGYRRAGPVEAMILGLLIVVVSRALTLALSDQADPMAQSLGLLAGLIRFGVISTGSVLLWWAMTFRRGGLAYD